jgi:hypothetical protein
VVVAEVGADVVEDVPQDASSIATTNKKLKPNQITLFFIFPPFLFINDKIVGILIEPGYFKESL